MKIILPLLLAVSLLVAACSDETTQPQISSFDDCVNAGYPVMESDPEQCSDGTRTFTNTKTEKIYVSMDPQECTLIKFMCEEEKRPFFDELGCGCTDAPLEEIEVEPAQKPCTKEYMPVCGEIQVQCITTPCDPINTTFANRCLAENENAQNIVEGACQEEANPEGACLSFDGNWLEEYQECEGMSQELCENLGGEFNECASACRNDPDAEMCILMCVQVCSFN